MTNSQELIATESLSDSHCLVLNSLLYTMIPPDSTLSIPGAGDPAIVERIVKSIRVGALQQVSEGLNEVEALTHESSGLRFVECDQAEREECFHSHGLAQRSFVRTLGSIAIHCYYTDPRVMESLEMEPRPPFPQGFELEQGDWSLLDPVRERPKIYRNTP